MIRSSLCLLAGATAVQLISFPPQSDLIGGVLVALILLLPAIRRADLLFICAGGLAVWLASNSLVDSRIAREFDGDNLLTSVRIADFPVKSGNSVTFIAAPVEDPRVPPRIRLSWQQPPVGLHIGDVWQFELKLRRPRGSSNPGTMDYEAWLFRERISATGYVVTGWHNRLLDSQTSSGIEKLRSEYVRGIQRRFDDDDVGAVIAAIAVGARHLISKEQWERYARTGTTHLMAISGLHIGLAAAFAYLIASLAFGVAGARHPHRASLVFALCIAATYTMLSGFAVPAQRALIMCALATAALLSRRDVGAAKVLAAAAVLILLVDPLATLRPGFKLSFAAVALLIWLAHRVSARATIAWRRGAYQALALSRIQVSLLLGLMPLTVLEFDRFSIVAPAVNLVAVPLFTLVTVPSALISAGSDGLIADLTLTIAAHSIAWLEELIAIAATLRASSVQTAAVEGICWLLVFAPAAWVALPGGWPGRSAAVLSAAALAFWRPEAPPEDCVDVTALDVGHGLSVVVRTHDRVLVYDTGAVYPDGATAAERVVVPYLRSRGIRRIDRIVVSHGDADHAGGVAAITEAFAIRDILSGEPLRGIETGPCLSGASWYWDKVNFSVLHPQSATSTGNDASCVLLIRIGVHRILLTGDIEKQVEADLVRRRVLPRVALVTVPHHGSRTSSIGPFVSALAPEYAIVSAAYDNHWGFPKFDVVARWSAAGAEVLNTAESGAVSVLVCQMTGVARPREWRKQRHRIWHDPVS